MKRKSFMFTMEQLNKCLDVMDGFANAVGPKEPKTVMGLFMLTADMAEHIEPINEQQVKLHLLQPGINILKGILGMYLTMLTDKEFTEGQVSDDEIMNTKLMIVSLSNAA